MCPSIVVTSISVGKFVILAVKTIQSLIVINIMADTAKDEQQLTDLVT